MSWPLSRFFYILCSWKGLFHPSPLTIGTLFPHISFLNVLTLMLSGRLRIKIIKLVIFGHFLWKYEFTHVIFLSYKFGTLVKLSTQDSAFSSIFCSVVKCQSGTLNLALWPGPSQIVLVLIFWNKFLLLFRVGGCLATEKGNLTFLVTVCALPYFKK